MDNTFFEVYKYVRSNNKSLIALNKQNEVNSPVSLFVNNLYIFYRRVRGDSRTLKNLGDTSKRQCLLNDSIELFKAIFTSFAALERCNIDEAVINEFREIKVDNLAARAVSSIILNDINAIQSSISKAAKCWVIFPAFGNYYGDEAKIFLKRECSSDVSIVDFTFGIHSSKNCFTVQNSLASTLKKAGFALYIGTAGDTVSSAAKRVSDIGIEAAAHFQKSRITLDSIKGDLRRLNDALLFDRFEQMIISSFTPSEIKKLKTKGLL